MLKSCYDFGVVGHFSREVSLKYDDLAYNTECSDDQISVITNKGWYLGSLGYSLRF